MILPAIGKGKEDLVFLSRVHTQACMQQWNGNWDSPIVQTVILSVTSASIIPSEMWVERTGCCCTCGHPDLRYPCCLLPPMQSSLLGGERGVTWGGVGPTYSHTGCVSPVSIFKFSTPVFHIFRGTSTPRRELQTPLFLQPILRAILDVMKIDLLSS